MNKHFLINQEARDSVSCNFILSFKIAKNVQVKTIDQGIVVHEDYFVHYYFKNEGKGSTCHILDCHEFYYHINSLI